MIRKLQIKANIIKGDFSSEGFIYVDSHGRVTCEITDRIKWLTPIKVHCLHKEIDTESFKAYEEKYPQYKGYIWIY